MNRHIGTLGLGLVSLAMQTQAMAASATAEVCVARVVEAVQEQGIGNPVLAYDFSGGSVNNLWPPNHKFATIQIIGYREAGGNPSGLGVTLSSDPGMSQSTECAVRVVSITHDEFVQETIEAAGSGNTWPDAKRYCRPGDDPSVAQLDLRAERSGLGNGRVYTIAVQVTPLLIHTDDGAGNVNTVTSPVGTETKLIEVKVPHDQRVNGTVGNENEFVGANAYEDEEYPMGESVIEPKACGGADGRHQSTGPQRDKKK